MKKSTVDWSIGFFSVPGCGPGENSRAYSSTVYGCIKEGGGEFHGDYYVLKINFPELCKCMNLQNFINYTRTRILAIIN